VDIQEEGCRALINLATNDDNQVLIVNAGGIAAIVSGMKDRVDHVDMQVEGCGALRNFAKNAENRVSIAEARGIVAIVSGTKAHT